MGGGKGPGTGTGTGTDTDGPPVAAREVEGAADGRVVAVADSTAVVCVGGVGIGTAALVEGADRRACCSAARRDAAVSEPRACTDGRAPTTATGAERCPTMAIRKATPTTTARASAA